MSTKYFKVKKDTFMWLEGAIISNKSNSNQYTPVEDVWNKVELETEYISAHIIENPLNEDFFERVYPSSTDKMVFVTKEALKDAYKNFVK